MTQRKPIDADPPLRETTEERRARQAAGLADHQAQLRREAQERRDAKRQRESDKPSQP